MTPTLHVIFGPSGAGKSTYASDLARRERAVTFSIDDWMARLFAQDMPQQPDFNWLMERVERCEAQIWSTAAAVMATGTSVVLDLGLLRRSDRARVAEIARRGPYVALFRIPDDAALDLSVEPGRWRYVDDERRALAERLAAQWLDGITAEAEAYVRSKALPLIVLAGLR